MPFLLMVFLTVACLPKWDSQAAPGWVDSTFWSAVLTWSAVALLALEAFWSARRVRRAVERDPGRRDRTATRYERGRFGRQLLLIAVYALSLYGFSWGWAVAQLWSWDGRGASPIVGVKVLTLAPFFVSLLLTWVFAYDADRSLFLAAYRQPDGDPFARAFLDGGPAAPVTPIRAAAKEFGGRWSYVAFQARQKLALVFLPVLLLVAQQEISLQIDEKFQSEWAWQLSAAAIVGVLAVMASLPWMVRLALGLKPLPPGPTRDRLMAAARRLRFRCSDVLLWDTRGGMANAMVIGVLPWPRYVVFTDRFLEEFNGDEVEAVFGHEVGHVKHQHMLYYLGFFMLSMAVMLYACLYASSLWPGLGGGSLGAFLDDIPLNDAWIPAGAVFLLAYMFLVFGFLSRRCERQADVYGCRAVSCGRGDCLGHEIGAPLTPSVRGLCPTGIRTFIYALEKVASVNGMSRDRPGFLQSWQHGSIARRVAFLYGLLKDPTAERRFQRRVALVKWGMVVVLGAALAVLIGVCPPATDGTDAAPKEPSVEAPDQVPNAGVQVDLNSTRS
jgi:STE24 endopeptidase